MKKIFAAAILFSCFYAFCGTLIYKGTNNEKKILSEIDIVSIDKNIVTIQIGKTTRNIHFSKIFKYYDTDINMNLAFDDNTSDYNLHVSNLKTPVNLKGVTKKAKKNAQNNKFSFEFSIQTKTKKGQSKNIKTPYFYLYLLTTSGKAGTSNISVFSYPESAKIKNTKNYNEAVMLERAISSERPVINPRYLTHDTMEGKHNKVSIDIGKIGNREIIAYYLIAWGKDEIVFTENKILNSKYEVSKNWHLTHRSAR